MFQEQVSDRLEGQRQVQAAQFYHSQVDRLDQWLVSMRSAVAFILGPQEETDVEDQLAECHVRAPSAV